MLINAVALSLSSDYCLRRAKRCQSAVSGRPALTRWSWVRFNRFYRRSGGTAHDPEVKRLYLDGWFDAPS